MAIQDFKIVGQFNRSRSLDYDNQDLVNLYISFDPEEVHPSSLEPLPGIRKISDPTGNKFRILNNQVCREKGLYQYRDYLYGVYGNIFFKMDKNENLTQLGVLKTSEGYIEWANNASNAGRTAKQVGLCDGAYLYVYNVDTNTFAEVTSIQASGFPPNPISIYYQDLRLFVRFVDDDRLFFSDQGDFTAFNSLNFIQQISRPSVAKAISGVSERLLLLGDVSTEIWEPRTYPSNEPIQRDNNLLYEFGVVSTASVVKGLVSKKEGQPLPSFVAWLTTSTQGRGVFVMSTGGAPVQISTIAVNRYISQFDRIDDCFGITYAIDGAIFIEWSFPSEDRTLVYEVITGTWSRKENHKLNRSSLNGIVYFNDMFYCGTSYDSVLYELSDDFYGEDTFHLRKKRTTYNFELPGRQKIRANIFKLRLQPGIVNPSQDPLIYMSYSMDGGYTFNNPVPMRMGKIGEFNYEPFWTNLGIGESFCFRIECWESVPFFILSASLDYDVLKS